MRCCETVAIWKWELERWNVRRMTAHFFSLLMRINWKKEQNTHTNTYLHLLLSYRLAGGIYASFLFLLLNVNRTFFEHLEALFQSLPSLFPFLSFFFLYFGVDFLLFTLCAITARVRVSTLKITKWRANTFNKA